LREIFFEINYILCIVIIVVDFKNQNQEQTIFKFCPLLKSNGVEWFGSNARQLKLLSYSCRRRQFLAVLIPTSYGRAHCIVKQCDPLMAGRRRRYLKWKRPIRFVVFSLRGRRETGLFCVRTPKRNVFIQSTSLASTYIICKCTHTYIVTRRANYTDCYCWCFKVFRNYAFRFSAFKYEKRLCPNSKTVIRYQTFVLQFFVVDFLFEKHQKH